MAEIVNLNRFRKAKTRSDKARAADTNRVAFGTPKALKTLNAVKADKTARAHDGRRLEKDEEVPK